MSGNFLIHTGKCAEYFECAVRLLEVYGKFPSWRCALHAHAYIRTTWLSNRESIFCKLIYLHRTYLVLTTQWEISLGPKTRQALQGIDLTLKFLDLPIFAIPGNEEMERNFPPYISVVSKVQHLEL